MKRCIKFLVLMPLVGSVATSIGAEGNKVQMIPGWGKVMDPDGDSDFSLEGGKLKVSIPGTVHGLAVERGNMSAPRVLQEVNGDFVAQVNVSGAFPPGTTSLVSGRRAFQGAGLVLWQDSNNYVRLERAQLVVQEQTMSYASFELRRNGQFERAGNASEHPLQGNATSLRLERHGDKISASVSSDGVQWTSLEPMVAKLTKTARVGVVAGHNTSTPLTVEFEGFKLTPVADAPASSMPTDFKEWLGVIGSITTVIAFLMYLHERRKRLDHDTHVLGFLHGIKPMVEAAAQKDSAWRGFVEQINDTLSRLQPPKGKSSAIR